MVIIWCQHLIQGLFIQLDFSALCIDSGRCSVYRNQRRVQMLWNDD